MKKLILTGVSSFIGFHLANFFSKDYIIYGTLTKKIDNYSSIQKLRLKKLVNKIKLIENFDLKNHILINKTISKIKPDIFIHHAGHAKNYNSFDYDLKKGYQINILPLPIIFKSLSENGCNGIIITGSSLEYSDNDSSDHETDLCYPSLPYGFIKLSQTIYSQQLSSFYKLPTRVARVYIPFGPYDSPNKLIPYVFHQLINNKTAKLTSCYQKRDFIYIDDLLMIYKFIIQDLSNGNFEIYNCASGKSTRLRLLINMISKTLGTSNKLLDFSKEKPYNEPLLSFANIDKLKKSLVFNTDLERSIKKYYKFLKMNN